MLKNEYRRIFINKLYIIFLSLNSYKYRVNFTESVLNMFLKSSHFVYFKFRKLFLLVLVKIKQLTRTTHDV